MRRLSQAGFKGEFVRPAILPDWWSDACAEDPALLPDVEIRVARFLDLPVSAIRNPAEALMVPSYGGAQLRRVRDLDRDRLAPAIHSAMQIASAVVRNLQASVPAPDVPPEDGLVWREQISQAGEAIKLEGLLDNLWQRGIPVVALDILPAPSFQGLSCIVDGRPVILVGHKHDTPGRIAFFVAHEVRHISAGDCAPDRPVVDQEEEVTDNTDMEHRADQYATRLLVGSDDLPEVNATDWQNLANTADEFEQARGVDASAVIFAWARRTGDYATATMAVKALYAAQGAQRLLRERFDLHIDLVGATEADRALLGCVFGDPERDAPAN